MGICRGMQALNVYFGGDLYSHIPGHQQPRGDLVHGTLRWDSWPAFWAADRR